MNCPFCGVVTDVPHKTQGACIDALQEEIGRVRSLLQRTETSHVPARTGASQDDPDFIPPHA